jgi:tetratricopeptide (TPR) repeat protein
MNMAPDLTVECPPATDGEIAVVNLQSARRRSWSRFSENPHRPGVAELIVEQEWQVAQFLGDFNALDRLEMLVIQLVHAEVPPVRRALIQAQVASIGHRFDEARGHLEVAEGMGAEPESVSRLASTIDQACGARLDELLDARRRSAAGSDSLEELVPLGALLMDLNKFTEADEVYRRALRLYSDVSPFAVALVCFQLGLLWGEAVADRQTRVAAQWYHKAIDYLPSYTKARVHLAEIYSSWGQLDEAETLLAPMVASSDPEVRWRLADVLLARGNVANAEGHLQAARSRFEDLLGRHLLAFADHGAEFYAASGNDSRRALDLAYINVANRPTLRAFEQAHAIAVRVGNVDAAAELQAEATQRWSAHAAFHSSSLKTRAETMERGETAS